MFESSIKMFESSIIITLKDGIIVERKPFTDNVNPKRVYRVWFNGEVVADNLLYFNIQYILRVIRK